MDDDVLSVLRAYPRIYLACHREHRTRASSSTGLTSRDGTLLAHIAADGSTPAQLAQHLGIARSTLSAALTRLARQGYLTIATDDQDARRRFVRLTAAGRAAVSRDSVLDPERVAAMLERLSPADRRRAIDGLAALGAAAAALQEGENG